MKYILIATYINIMTGSPVLDIREQYFSTAEDCHMVRDIIINATSKADAKCIGITSGYGFSVEAEVE